MANNLKTLRIRAKMTQLALAEAMGTTRSQYVKLESGERRLSDIWITRAADALNVDAGELVTTSGRDIPVVGFVGAGAEAVLFSESQNGHDPNDPLDTVKAPLGASPQTVAVEIRGDSLGSFFDRWIVFYDDVRHPPTSEMMKKPCVIGLEDGRVLIKKLTRGREPGLYTLLSNVEAPIYDVPIQWAAQVISMQPR